MPLASQEHLDAAVQLVESGGGGETASLTSSKSEGGSQVRGLRLILLAPDDDAADNTGATAATSSSTTSTTSTIAPAVHHMHTLSGQSNDSGFAPSGGQASGSQKCPSGRSSWSSGSLSALSCDSGNGTLSFARLDIRSGDRYGTSYGIRPPTRGPSEATYGRALLETPGGSFPRAHPAPPPPPPLQGALRTSLQSTVLYTLYCTHVLYDSVFLFVSFVASSALNRNDITIRRGGRRA